MGYNIVLTGAIKNIMTYIIKLTVPILVIASGILFINCSKTYATRELTETTLGTAKSSEYIVVARCVSTYSEWNEQGSLIYTYVTFQIENTVKGDDSGDELTMRLIGGQVGDRILSAPDIPTFDEAEDVVLFLGPKNKAGYPTLTNMHNGVVRIRTDEISGQRTVTTPISGMQLYKENTSRALPDNRDSKVSLEDFIYSLKKVTN
jgi:hypothetical protein